jgi:DNA-binding response OmpR family regulator
MGELKKVLIVDDEKFVTDTLEGFFHRRGYQIFKAEDGSSCLKVIKNENPDLVLLDIKLPELNGIEILKVIRGDYPWVRTIVMTAYDLEYKKQVDSIGCDAFFLKPLLIEELTQKVEELLAEARVQAEIPLASKTPTTPAPLVRDIPQDALPKARLLVVSPRNLICSLLRDYFSQREICAGIYEVSEAGLEQLEQIKKFLPDIILLDVMLIGMLGEFGLTLMKMPQPPKEIILFGDPAIKWEEAEALIRRGTKFVPIPSDLYDKMHPIKETVRRLNETIKEVCFKHGLFSLEST